MLLVDVIIHQKRVREDDNIFAGRNKSIYSPLLSGEG
jgi:hypothetical protein